MYVRIYACKPYRYIHTHHIAISTARYRYRHPPRVAGLAEPSTPATPPPLYCSRACERATGRRRALSSAVVCNTPALDHIRMTLRMLVS